jgi:alkanesulfonate monooxygenase
VTDALHIIVPPHTEGFGLGSPLPTADYLGRLSDHLAAAEAIGATGAFVYDFPGALDPWLAAFDVLTLSTSLSPVVAVRPHQDTPEAVARRVVDLEYRFGRPTHLNLVAGATSSSRAPSPGAPGAPDPAVAARRALAEFSRRCTAEVGPRLPARASGPRVYTPASKTAGVVPATGILLLAKPRRALAEEVDRLVAAGNPPCFAMLTGFVARDSTEEAWEAAHAIYAPDRRQAVAGALFASQVVSSQHRASYAFAADADVHDEMLWYGAPMRGIDAPKLVGSYDDVRGVLDRYRELGVTELIVDLPASADEYRHIGRLFGHGTRYGPLPPADAPS